MKAKSFRVFSSFQDPISFSLANQFRHFLNCFSISLESNAIEFSIEIKIRKIIAEFTHRLVVCFALIFNFIFFYRQFTGEVRLKYALPKQYDWWRNQQNMLSFSLPFRSSKDRRRRSFWDFFADFFLMFDLKCLRANIFKCNKISPFERNDSSHESNNGRVHANWSFIFVWLLNEKSHFTFFFSHFLVNSICFCSSIDCRMWARIVFSLINLT